MSKRHPHEDAPECPHCGTDVFVACSMGKQIPDKKHTWECHFCGLSEFQVTGRHILFATENTEIYDKLGREYV
jgi:transcription elongation factor Elf1